MTDYRAIIWSRRQRQAITKIWHLLLSMIGKKIKTISRLKRLEKIIKMDLRTVTRFIWFRIFQDSNNISKSIILTDRDTQIIKEIIKINSRYSRSELMLWYYVMNFYLFNKKSQWHKD